MVPPFDEFLCQWNDTSCRVTEHVLNPVVSRVSDTTHLLTYLFTEIFIVFPLVTTYVFRFPITFGSTHLLRYSSLPKTFYITFDCAYQPLGQETL